ncbi:MULTISPECIES: DUF4064 domain-containing protein [Enterococcus]|uniref:DUF4064 domain-containing protein n=1 Tax=Enterococcus durans TaxID=53345 RepID=A0A367CJL2_9ENTE|nr:MULTISPECIES: DUF4064 domain-containing protein [Enterococcus]MBE8849048.1 DUF4064 domain-containing protein [Enterococcus durans]MDB1652882.1 DUF4064 domain-containing protein [Enterococcus durans]MDB1655845.1 DUF4064 domain-containing protein [Enterococcus durans]MDB1664600.1 DUF4064 domain-containing protein [Enterococcus durans]MDB1669713.1 DUF4064 domain-containing protein [Enterococcus durans]
MKRKWEAIVGIIGGILALVFFGGLAVTLKKMSIKDFETSYQALKLEKTGTLDNTFHLLQDMTGLFAITLFISLIFLVVAVFFSIKEKYLIIAASLYLVAGLILLLGTQFIAFPFTFFYFMAAVLTVYRIKIKKGQVGNV